MSRPRLSCVIATTPRTGSWLLAEGLNDTDVAGEPQEYFGWEGFAAWCREFGLPPDPPYLRYVEEALAYGTTDNGVFSTKLHWSQLEIFAAKVRATPGTWPESSGELLSLFLPDLRFVHLYRRDTARQAISYWRAVQAGRWWDDGRVGGTVPTEDLDLQQIRWCEDLLVQHDGNWRRLLAELHRPTLTVAYEDLVADRDGTVERVLDLLDVDHAPLSLPATRLRRQADDRTERWLATYRTARADLQSLPSRWRWAGKGIEPAG